MALTAGHLKVEFRGVWASQKVMCVQWYRTDGAAFLTADPASLGQALWNDVKTLWRAAHGATAYDLTTSLYVSEPGANGAYGEYAIPANEQQGTRSIAGLGDIAPTFCAAGFRQTVANRTTRPGHKRMWGLFEADFTSQDLAAGYLTVLTALSAKFAGAISLGAPVATGVLYPEIVKVNRATGDIEAYQDVAGIVVSSLLTTQVSRKWGRGA